MVLEESRTKTLIELAAKLTENLGTNDKKLRLDREAIKKKIANKYTKLTQ